MDLGDSNYDNWSIPLYVDDNCAEFLSIDDLSITNPDIQCDSVSFPDFSETSTLSLDDVQFDSQVSSSDQWMSDINQLSPGSYHIGFTGESDQLLELITFGSEAGELEESSVDSEKYPRDYGYSTNQADASDSSSDDSSDSRVLLISNSTYVCSEKKKSRKAKKTWSKSEDEKLLMICKELNVEKNHRCWKQVAKKLNTNRTPKQCREHYNHITSQNKKSTWSVEEDAVLELYLDGKISHEEVCKRLMRSSKQINERRAILLRNRRTWNQEEDCIIRALMNQGKKPREITNALKGKGYQRTNQQVKDRMTILSEFHP